MKRYSVRYRLTFDNGTQHEDEIIYHTNALVLDARKTFWKIIIERLPCALFYSVTGIQILSIIEG